MSVLFTRRGAAPKTGTPASDFAVGGSVFLNVGGSLKEFIIVHQGNPNSSLYDASCDGTWLLMKDLYEEWVWDSSDNDYANSDIHAYLSGTFLGLFDASIQTAIKQIKIPYINGNGTSGSVVTGASGLSVKIFLLGGYEVGWTTNDSGYFAEDGACLDYFNGSTSTDRVAYFDGTATAWWLRSAVRTYSQNPWIVLSDGTNAKNYKCTSPHGIRPALILPSNALFDPGTREFVGVAA